jgi:hypothetical protein
MQTYLMGNPYTFDHSVSFELCTDNPVYYEWILLLGGNISTSGDNIFAQANTEVYINLNGTSKPPYNTLYFG